jgi:hypothetical protein
MNSLIGLIASSWVLMSVIFLGTVALLTIAVLSVEDHKRGAIVFAAASLVLGVLWVVCAFTMVVQPATNMVVVYSDGTVDSQTFQPGLHTRPLVGASFYEFQAQQNYQWCPDFTPALQSGVEVKVTVCYRLDASNIQWRDQYLKWHTDQAGIFESWRKEIAAYVALAMKDVSVTDIRNDRLSVARDILAKTEAWSETSGVHFSSALISNWDFTNPKVGEQYDSQIAASLQSEALAAKQQAAVQDRQLQLYLADTYAQVLKARAQADRGALEQLGLPNSQWSYYLINQRLLSFVENAKSANIVLSVGGQQSPFVYPTTSITDTTK